MPLLEILGGGNVFIPLGTCMWNPPNALLPSLSQYFLKVWVYIDIKSFFEEAEGIIRFGIS